MNYTFRFSPVIARIDQLLAGLATTLWVSAAVIALGFLVGLLGALASRSRSLTLRRVFAAYVEAIRNTPFLAQLFFIYFGLPALGLALFPSGIHAVDATLHVHVAEVVDEAAIERLPVGAVGTDPVVRQHEELFACRL